MNKLKEIQKEADIFFLENDDIYSKIVHLIDEIKQTMDKFEIPGIPEVGLKQILDLIILMQLMMLWKMIIIYI